MICCTALVKRRSADKNVVLKETIFTFQPDTMIPYRDFFQTWLRIKKGIEDNGGNLLEIFFLSG